MMVYFDAQKHWKWLLVKQENKFQGNILNFTWKFCLILPQMFDFWKSPKCKKCKCDIICGKKIKCARTTGNKLSFFYLGITVCTINTNEYTIKQVSSTNRIPLSIKRYDLHSFPFVVQGKSEGDIFTQFWRKFENITGI